MTSLLTPTPLSAANGRGSNSKVSENLSEQLVEQFNDWRTAELKIDREARLVRNVALAGTESRNGYRYTAEALQQAAPLYRERPVFLDHATAAGRPFERSTRDLVGMVVRPRFEAGRVRGDVQVLDTEAGRTFLALVEAALPSVGMSHVVVAERDAKRSTVGKIHDVICVDAVAFPATAATFREQTLAVSDVLFPPAPRTFVSPSSPCLAHGETATEASRPDVVTSSTSSPGPSPSASAVAVSLRDTDPILSESAAAAAATSSQDTDPTLADALPASRTPSSTVRKILEALNEQTALLREWLPRIANGLSNAAATGEFPGDVEFSTRERRRTWNQSVAAPNQPLPSWGQAGGTRTPSSRVRNTPERASLSDETIVARIQGRRAA